MVLDVGLDRGARKLGGSWSWSRSGDQKVDDAGLRAWLGGDERKVGEILSYV
jgi:hypothetical protein